MNYNKIKETIKRLNVNASKMTVSIGITEQTYHKLVKNQSTTVDTLEKITNYLGLKMSYWWEDEPLEMNEPVIKYNPAISKLKKENAGYKKENKRLRKELVSRDKMIKLLEEKIEGKESNSKALGCG